MRRLVYASLFFVAAAAGCGTPEIQTQPVANSAAKPAQDSDSAASDEAAAKDEAMTPDEVAARQVAAAYAVAHGGVHASYFGPFLPINCEPQGMPTQGPGCDPLPPPVNLPPLQWP
jgi:hypothetical protein